MKTKELDGILFAEDVDISNLDTESEASPDLVEELKKKAKIRITTMIDMDLYQLLKKHSAMNGDGRYQTYLNRMLRQSLTGKAEPTSADMMKFMQQMKISSKKISDMNDRINELEHKLEVVERAKNTPQPKKRRKHA